ncbi:hypothetical protein RND81_03G178000 [Saponaria officinalis]|uniref:Membrane-associated kinase regulator n=1 Tax=Saponaria officinalis TaxID=3572 RepID=A0AAW1M7W9_SAPOF
MAVDIFTDTSSNREISPRISFSHDLSNCDILPIEPHLPLKSSPLDYDFDFCFSKRSCDQDSSMADELFANGVILPIQIKRKEISISSNSKSSSSSSSSSSSRLLSPPHSSSQNISEAVNVRETEEKQRKENDNKSSFWTFKRSSSLNCGRLYRRGLCSLPLLLRSKSTGSTVSAKKSLITSIDEPHLNHNYHKKQGSLKKSSSTHHQKPPLKKKHYGVIQVSPVINVTTGSLFGFCSVFSNGKDKGKKK